MQVDVTFKRRISTTGDDPKAYIEWEEQIRDVPRAEKKGWYWETYVAQKTVKGSDIATIVACVEALALKMFKDPNIEAVAADGSIQIGRTTVRMQTHIDREDIEEKR